jgi:hypothetical protein
VQGLVVQLGQRSNQGKTRSFIFLFSESKVRQFWCRWRQHFLLKCKVFGVVAAALGSSCLFEFLEEENRLFCTGRDWWRCGKNDGQSLFLRQRTVIDVEVLFKKEEECRSGCPVSSGCSSVWTGDPSWDRSGIVSVGSSAIFLDDGVGFFNCDSDGTKGAVPVQVWLSGWCTMLSKDGKALVRAVTAKFGSGEAATSISLILIRGNIKKKGRGAASAADFGLELRMCEASSRLTYQRVRFDLGRIVLLWHLYKWPVDR